MTLADVARSVKVVQAKSLNVERAITTGARRAGIRCAYGFSRRVGTGHWVLGGMYSTEYGAKDWKLSQGVWRPGVCGQGAHVSHSTD
jgi:hypothetical protein